jgi:non-specific protein-tyrosine kinase
LAAGGAYLLEYLDDTVKSTDEVKRLWPITVLGTVPDIKENETGSSRRLVMLQNTPSPAVEAYRALRTNLQFASVDRPLRQILVTSAQPEEGKSLTAANLSASLARAGKKVILVDADLHRPTQHRLFKLFNNVGVTTALLNDEIDYESLLQQTTLPELSVLTSGPLPPNPAELLGSKRMQEVLSALTQYADIVVIDSPPVTAVVDAVILSTQIDGVLMVMRADKSSRDAIKRALNALQQVNAHLLGAVLNGVSEHRQEYYLHNYGYYSSVYGRALTTTANTTPSANGEVPAFPMPTAVAPATQDEPVTPQAMPFPAPTQPPMPQQESWPQPVQPVVAYPIAPVEEQVHEPDYADANITFQHPPSGQRRSTNILRRRTALPWK